MRKYVWLCSLCLHKTKRKSNVIRHIKLIHGVDARHNNNNSKKDDGINLANDSADTLDYKKSVFYCNKCLYNSVKKYNLMRHFKNVHSSNERQRQEDLQLSTERHYTRKEFEEIMTRLKTSFQSIIDQDNSKLVTDVCVETDKSEARIREGYIKALELLTQ